MYICIFKSSNNTPTPNNVTFSNNENAIDVVFNDNSTIDNTTESANNKDNTVEVAFNNN
jgi:hypothetical protein